MHSIQLSHDRSHNYLAAVAGKISILGKRLRREGQSMNPREAGTERCGPAHHKLEE